mmetsp:Transcript_6209/g.12199  ORF Transcript_6209/g.12199 Transcript_6209/m.12199 type:complete len:108 (+) Transcript_6209:20-343(+)
MLLTTATVYGGLAATTEMHPRLSTEQVEESTTLVVSREGRTLLFLWFYSCLYQTDNEDVPTIASVVKWGLYCPAIALTLNSISWPYEILFSRCWVGEVNFPLGTANQ